MTRLQDLVALSRACKAAYDTTPDPTEREQLSIIGGQVAAMIGRHVKATTLVEFTAKGGAS